MVPSFTFLNKSNPSVILPSLLTGLYGWTVENADSDTHRPVGNTPNINRTLRILAGCLDRDLKIDFFTIANNPASDRKIPKKSVSSSRAGKPVKLTHSVSYTFDREDDFRPGDLRRSDTRQDQSSNGLAKCFCDILHLFFSKPRVNGQGEDLP